MQTARVSSISALREFKAALQQYLLNVQKALCEADLQLDRARDAVGHDLPMYWEMELKKRHDELLQAQDDLRRVQLSIAFNPPSAAEQKKAVKVAQQREQEALKKRETCRKWQRQVEQAAIEYRGQVQHIAGAVESDLPRAIAQLDRAVASLEGYTAVAAPRAEDDLLEEEPAPMTGGGPTDAADPFAGFPVAACRALRRITPDVSVRPDIPALPEAEPPGPRLTRRRRDPASAGHLLSRPRLAAARQAEAGRLGRRRSPGAAARCVLS